MRKFTIIIKPVFIAEDQEDKFFAFLEESLKVFGEVKIDVFWQDSESQVSQMLDQIAEGARKLAAEWMKQQVATWMATGKIPKDPQATIRTEMQAKFNLVATTNAEVVVQLLRKFGFAWLEDGLMPSDPDVVVLARATLNARTDAMAGAN